MAHRYCPLYSAKLPQAAARNPLASDRRPLASDIRPILPLGPSVLAYNLQNRANTDLWPAGRGGRARLNFKNSVLLIDVRALL